MPYSRAAGLELPDGLDVPTFDEVSIRMAELANPNDSSSPWKRNVHHAFASAWNGVAFRFRAAFEYDQEFRRLISLTTSPGGDERFHQETALYGSVGATLSCLECFYMAAYAGGSAKGTSSFRLTADADLLKYPRDVASAFLSDYPTHTFTAVLTGTVDDPELRALQDLRNALAHRGILPRKHFLSTIRDTPSAIPSNPRSIAARIAYDAHLGPDTTAQPLGWVVSVLAPLTRGLRQFLG